MVIIERPAQVLNIFLRMMEEEIIDTLFSRLILIHLSTKENFQKESCESIIYIRCKKIW